MTANRKRVAEWERVECRGCYEAVSDFLLADSEGLWRKWTA